MTPPHSSGSSNRRSHHHSNKYRNRRSNSRSNNYHDDSVKSRDFSLPGTSSLHEMLDHRILILLRDQRTLIADLKSYDQYANLVLENCLERICIQKKYGDLPLGTQLIRGENIHMLGTFHEDRMTDANSFSEVSLQEILMLQKEERLRKEKEEREMRQKGLSLGLEGKEIDDSVV